VCKIKNLLTEMLNRSSNAALLLTKKHLCQAGINATLN
jgi:hypothetical protein